MKKSLRIKFMSAVEELQMPLNGVTGWWSAGPDAESKLVLVDLFCGAGGMSQGASDAGVECVLAVGNDPTALEAHRQNHPDAVHVCLHLGTQASLTELAGLIARVVGWWRRYHLHMSPECQKISQANCTSKLEDIDSTIRLMQWCLELPRLLQPQPASWSLEQVHSHRLGCNFPHDQVLVHTERFDVPQARTRMIMGSRALLDRLERHQQQAATRVTPHDVLPWLDASRHLIKLGTTNTPIRGKSQQAAAGSKHRRISVMENVRPLNVPSYTVTQKQLYSWFRPLRKPGIKKLY
eukprot:2338318-Prymnesium_polylepis.1